MLTHLELLLQARPPSMPRGQQLIHVPVQVCRRHLRLSTQDGFHQGVVDKNILFLWGPDHTDMSSEGGFQSCPQLPQTNSSGDDL